MDLELRKGLGVMGPIAELNERLITRYDPSAAQGFFDSRALRWVQGVEARFPEIRAELDALLEMREMLPPFQRVHAAQAELTDDSRWRAYFFRVYGWDIRRAREQCPRTWQALRAIPNMTLAMFSVLEPGKVLPPHRGPNKGVLRYHLALKVPSPDASLCGIRVRDEVRAWHEGESLLFDDCHEHRAWNLTDGVRVVLFVDVLRPLPGCLSAVNRAMMGLAKYVSADVREVRRNATRFAEAIARRGEREPEVAFGASVAAARRR